MNQSATTPPGSSAREARTQAILTAPPLPVLLRMASPNAVAFVVQASVSMTEVWYVGQLGTVSLAAMALVFPGLMLMQMLANGAMGGAVTSAVAQAIGRGQREDAERLIWHALFIAALAGVGFMLLYALLGTRVLDSFGASSAVRDASDAYAVIVFSGCGLIWTMALLSSVFRGMGNMRLPATLMVLGAAIQIPLSGTLILGWFGAPQLGIRGAAVSVLVVSALSTVLLLWRLAVSTDVLRLRLDRCRLEARLFHSILRVGLLSSLSPILTVLTISLINLVVAYFGVAALAGYGIASRIEFLLIPLVFGLGVSMTSMVGINMGAGNTARAERIGWTGGLSAAALAGSVGLLLALFPGIWVDLFTEDPATALAATAYLQIAGPVFAFQGLGLSLYFASQGAGRVAWPVIATFLRFLVGVGVAAAGVAWWGFSLEQVFLCTAAGMVIYGCVTAGALKLGDWRR